MPLHPSPADRNFVAMRPMTQRARLLRTAATPSEEMLWAALRNRRLLGTKWRRQQTMGRFVVDFFCAEHALVVEVDGGIHQGREEVDEERQRTLERSGLRVVRFSAADVEYRMPEVLGVLRNLVAPPE